MSLARLGLRRDSGGAALHRQLRLRVGFAVLLASLFAFQRGGPVFGVVLAGLTLAVSPLAFIFLGLVLVAVWLLGHGVGRVEVLVAGSLLAFVGAELMVLSGLPVRGLYYPFGLWRLLAGAGVGLPGVALGWKGRQPGGATIVSLFLSGWSSVSAPILSARLSVKFGQAHLQHQTPPVAVVGADGAVGAVGAAGAAGAVGADAAATAATTAPLPFSPSDFVEETAARLASVLEATLGGVGVTTTGAVGGVGATIVGATMTGTVGGVTEGGVGAVGLSGGVGTGATGTLGVDGRLVCAGAATGAGVGAGVGVGVGTRVAGGPDGLGVVGTGLLCDLWCPLFSPASAGAGVS